MPKSRVTVTLPESLVREIDRRERNRSRFVLEAVEHELERRRREELRRSLESPHPESVGVAEEGMDDWARSVGDDEVAGLLDPEVGVEVRWEPGAGWQEREA